MEERVIKIEIPEGYEVDKEKSTFERVVFKPKRESYEDVCRKLFYKKKVYYPDEYGDVISSELDEIRYKDLNNCTSENQSKKLLAINQLMNVAKYLNEDWKPDWNNDNERKFTIYINKNNTKICIDCKYIYNQCIVYFKTEELAQKAINILGEEIIKLALSTDW